MSDKCLCVTNFARYIAAVNVLNSNNVIPIGKSQKFQF